MTDRFVAYNIESIPKDEKERIFRRGTVISIKHPSIFEPVLNVIQKVDSNNIYFKLSKSFLKNNVLKGDTMSCQIFNDKYEYVLEGTIIDIDIHNPKYVQFGINEIKRYMNNRSVKRYLVSIQASISLEQTNKSIYSIIKNISIDGVNAVFREVINKNALVNITISAFINKEETLQFKARVVRSINRSCYTEYGFRIIEIDESNKNLLNRLIYCLEKNESSFVEEYLK